MDSLLYFKQNDQVLWRCLFIWACEGLSIPKALHIDVWETAGVTAMAAGGEQTQSAHACDVSLGARITPTPQKTNKKKNKQKKTYSYYTDIRTDIMQFYQHKCYW